MDVDADNIPKRMYPTIAPILSGVYVWLRFNLRIIRKDFVSGDICGLFFLIRSMGVYLVIWVNTFIASWIGLSFIWELVYTIMGISGIKVFPIYLTLKY